MPAKVGLSLVSEPDIEHRGGPMLFAAAAGALLGLGYIIAIPFVGLLGLVFRQHLRGRFLGCPLECEPAHHRSLRRPESCSRAL